MGRGLTTIERADRQRIMMRLRKWMESEGVSRQEVADALGITKGHLSTLINANRYATEAQCQKAMVLMDAKFAISKHDPRYEELGVSPLRKRKEMRPEPKKVAKPAKKKKKRAVRKPNNLRPLTKFEGQFVAEVARVWFDGNPKATMDEFTAVVRALSVGIRT